MQENDVKIPFEPSNLGQFMLFDWLQVTFKPFLSDSYDNLFSDYSVDDYLDNLYMKYYVEQVQRIHDYYDIFWYLFKIPRINVLFNVEKALFGYQFCYSYKNIKIFGSDSRPEMGVHLYLTGTACRELEDLGIEYVDIFKKLSFMNPNYTRIDVSYDDYQGKYWTLKRVANCIANVEVVTKFRSSLQIKKEDLISLDNIGHTIQFGSRASDIQFTFYDKLKERRCANYLVDENIKHWNRFEIRFRNEKAKAIIDNYLYFNDKYNFSDINIKATNIHLECESFSDYIKSIVNNYISFRRFNSKDKTRSRWKYQVWWLHFLDNCTKIQFQNKPIEYSIVKKRAWLDRSVSFSNFVVMLSDIKDLSYDENVSRYLYDLFKEGSEKFTEKDLQYVNEYRLSKGLNPFELNDVFDYIDDVKEVIVRK